MKNSLKSSLMVMVVVSSMTLSFPATSQAGSLLIPGGAIVQTARGALLLVPAMANAKDKDKKEPSGKDSKRGRSNDGLGGRYLDNEKGSSPRGRSGTYEDNGGRWSGGEGRYGTGGDSYDRAFAESSTEDMVRLVRQGQYPEDMTRLVKANSGTILAAALFLSVNEQALAPVLLEDHLAQYLQNQERLSEQAQNESFQVAMPIATPADQEKIMNQARRIAMATDSFNEISSMSIEQRTQLENYLISEGLDSGDQVVSIVTLNTKTVGELSEMAPEFSAYFQSLLLKNE